GPSAHGRALNVLAAALWSLDEIVEARDAARSAIAVLERTAATAELSRAHCARLRIEAVGFAPSAAIAAAPRALELAASAGIEEARIDAEITLGLAYGHQGRPDASALLEQAFAGVAGVPEAWRHAVLHATRAELAWLRGDRQRVLAVARAARDAPWFTELGRPSGELALWAARCGERLQPPEMAPKPVL